MDALFLLTQLSFALFGIAAAFHPNVRGLGWPARLSAAFLFGALLLSVEMTLLSLVNVVWSFWTIAIPLALSFWLARRWRNRLPAADPSPPGKIFLWPSVAPILAVIHLLAALISGRATSADYIFFWGVKAIRFAVVGGLENELLRWRYAIHIHPSYPPLFSNTLAWGAVVVGQLPWLGAVLTCALWLLAAVPLVYALLRLRLGNDAAFGAVCFWWAALAISLASSGCGGNAEATLLAYESVAVAALLIESRVDSVEARIVAAFCLGGTVATKIEGFFAWGLILAAVILRDVIWRKPSVMRRAIPLMAIPAAVAAVWFTYQVIHDVPMGDPTRTPGWSIHVTFLAPTIAAMLRAFYAGSFGLAWLVPLFFVLLWRGSRTRRWLVDTLPALVLTSGLLLVFLAYYLHEPRDPSKLIAWTLPRVVQPALSAWILACVLRGKADQTSGVR